MATSTDAGYHLRGESFRAVNTASLLLRAEDREEVLDAIAACNHSPNLSLPERRFLTRTGSVLHLSWSEDWLRLPVRVLEETTVLRVDLQITAADGAEWQNLVEQSEEAKRLLQRGATMLRLLVPDLPLPLASWVHNTGEILSRESHFTLPRTALGGTETQ